LAVGCKPAHPWFGQSQLTGRFIQRQNILFNLHFTLAHGDPLLIKQAQTINSIIYLDRLGPLRASKL
jgi:hypothetical protein